MTQRYATTDTIQMRLPKDLARLLLAAVADRRSVLERFVRDEAWGGAPGGSPNGASPVDSTRAFSTAERWTSISELAARVFSTHGGALSGPQDTARAFSTLPAGAPGSVLAARMFVMRAGFVPEWVGLLSLIEDFVATWDDPRQAPKRAGDRVYIRDGWRCMAPGCTSQQSLEEHHVVYRSRGGTDELSNRICLCRFHHQQGEHGGLARCRGLAPLNVRWELGNNGNGGVYRNEKKLSQGSNGDLRA